MKVWLQRGAYGIDVYVKPPKKKLVKGMDGKRVMRIFTDEFAAATIGEDTVLYGRLNSRVSRGNTFYEWNGTIKRVKRIVTKKTQKVVTA